MRIFLLVSSLVLAFATQGLAFEQNLVSTRALALQGGTASPYDNSAIFLNPAGVTLNNRYDMSSVGWLDQSTDQQLLHLSVVDGRTSPEIGAGLGWNRYTANTLPQDDIALALAQRYTTGALGIAGHYRIDRERFDVSGGKVKKTDLNLDVGVLFDPADQMLKLALVGLNLFDPPEKVTTVQREFVAGLGSRWLNLFEITGDVIYAPSAGKGRTVSWTVGGEVAPMPFFALRGSYGQFPAGPDRVGHWAAGIGAGVPNEFRVGYAYRHPIGVGTGGTHAAELALYFLP